MLSGTEYIDKAKENIENLKDVAGKTFKKSKKDVVSSSKDWFDYVEKHPVQSIAFGVLGYFAIKGLIK